MAFLDRIVKKIKENTLDKTDLDERLSRGVSSLQQSAIKNVGTPIRQTLQQIPGRVANTPLVSFTPAGQALPRQVASRTPTIGQYARGQIIKPIREGLRLARQPGLFNKGLGAAQIVGGAISATPAGAAWNVGVGTAAGVGEAIRKRTPLSAAINRNITQPTSLTEKVTGSTNPILNLAGDVLLTRNPKALVKDPLLIKGGTQALRSIFRKKPLRVSSDDVAMFDQAVDIIKSRKNLGRERTIATKVIDDLMEHYVKPTMKKADYQKVSSTTNYNKRIDAIRQVFGTRAPKPGAAPIPGVSQLTDKQPAKSVQSKGMKVAEAGLYDTIGNSKVRVDQSGANNFRVWLHQEGKNQHLPDKGFMGDIRTEALPDKDGLVELRGIGVFERGQGNGEKLLQRALQELQKKGVKGIRNTNDSIYENAGDVRSDALEKMFQRIMKNPDSPIQVEAFPNPRGKGLDYIASLKAKGGELNPASFTDQGIPNRTALDSSASRSLSLRTRGEGAYTTENISTSALDSNVINPNTNVNRSVSRVAQPSISDMMPAGAPPKSPDVPSGQKIPEKSVLDTFHEEIAQGSKKREQLQTTAKGTLVQRAKSQFLDRLSPVYDFVGRSRDAGKVAAENNPYRKLRLLAGVSGKVDAFIDTTLKPVIQREKDRLPDLSALLAFDRERELIGQGLKRRRSIEEINQGIAELQAKYGDEGFAQLQDSANQIRQTSAQLLDMIHDAGIIDDASYNALKAKGQFYTPFEAVEHIADELEKGRFGTGSFNVASQDVVNRIKDYEGAIADPLESLLRKIPKVIALTEKNKAVRSLIDMRNEAPDVYQDLIVPLKEGQLVPQGMGTINVFENGKNVRYAVPDIVEGAIKNLDAESSNILVNVGRWQAKMLRGGATAFNIGFIPVNVIRDVQDALTTELSEKGAVAMLQLLGSYPRAIYAAAKKDELYQQWLASGGAGGTMTEQIFKSPTKTIKDLTGERSVMKYTAKAIPGLISFANRVGEQSTRLARYSAGRARGESVAEAAFKGRDISLDFSKAGNTIKVLNQVIPFLNAGIQGSEKLMRLYRQNPVAATAYTATLYGTPAILLYRHNSQFQDFDDIPLSERQDNWIFIERDRTDEEKAKGEKVIGTKIPKGFLGRIMANTVDSGLDFMRQGDRQAFADAMLQIGAGISPVGLPRNKETLGQSLSQVLPPWVQAGVEGVTNTNLYFGSPIVPESLKRLPPPEQAREDTPLLYKNLGKLTGMSPLILENTVNTTAGGVGRQIAAAGSFDPEGALIEPITRRFSGVRGGKQAEKAYEEVEKEKQYTALRNKQIRDAYNAGDTEEFDRLTADLTTQHINQILEAVEDKEERAGLTPEQRAYSTLSKEERARLGESRPELRSELDFLEEAGAAEPKLASRSDEIKLDRVKNRVKDSGKPEEFAGFLFVPSGNTAKGIPLKPEVKDITLYGNDTLDVQRAEKYNTALETAINQAEVLNSFGKLSDEEAANRILELDDQKYVIKKGKIAGRKKAGGTGSGGGTGKKERQALAKLFREAAESYKPIPFTIPKTRRSRGKSLDRLFRKDKKQQPSTIEAFLAKRRKQATLPL